MQELPFELDDALLLLAVAVAVALAFTLVAAALAVLPRIAQVLRRLGSHRQPCRRASVIVPPRGRDLDERLVGLHFGDRL